MTSDDRHFFLHVANNHSVTIGIRICGVHSANITIGKFESPFHEIFIQI